MIHTFPSNWSACHQTSTCRDTCCKVIPTSYAWWWETWSWTRWRQMQCFGGRRYSAPPRRCTTKCCNLSQTQCRRWATWGVIIFVRQSATCDCHHAPSRCVVQVPLPKPAWSRFSCPRDESVDLHLFVHETQSCCTVRAQDNSTRRTIAHLAPLVSCCDTLASSTDQCHQLRFAWTQANHVLLLGRRIHRIPGVFSRTLDPHSDARIAATILDVSSPIRICHHQHRTLRSARNSRNIKTATNDHVARRISNQISEQTLDVDFITSCSCADVSGQLTNCVLDVRTIQPE